MPSILPKGKTQFFDANGNPLAGGQVYTYAVGTTTPKTTWSDIQGTVANANPLTLDSAGEALIWGSGQYRMQVYDALGNLIWDQNTSDPGIPAPTTATEGQYIKVNATGDGYENVNVAQVLTDINGAPWTQSETLITAAGLTPDPTNTAQLLAAEQKLFAAINGSASEAFNVSGPSNPATYPSLALSADNFPSSLSANGWKKYPDPNSPSGYFIEQWGTGAITSTGTGVTGATFTLPIAYPTAPLFCAAGYGGNTPDGTLGAITGSLYSLTQAEVAIYTSAAATNVAIQFWSKGY